MSAKPGLESPKSIGERTLLAVADLFPNPGNRKVVLDEEVRSLAQSIKETGLLYPIIVAPHPEKPDAYEIKAGERRWKALKLLRVENAPCLVVNGDATEAEILGVVENHHRRPLTSLEEAAAVRRLLELGLEAEAIARSLGRSRAWVARRSSLTQLSEKWMAEIQNPASKLAAWPPSHLELIARFPGEVQDQMLADWDGRLGHAPSLRDLDRATGTYLHRLASAPWKQEDEALCPKAGACAACPKRSSHAPDLFEEPGETNGKTSKGDRCLDPVCWSAKASAYLARRIEEARKEHANLVLIDATSTGSAIKLDSKGLSVLPEFDVTFCRKGDRKSVPALVVDGPGLGRIKWVQLPREKKPRTNGSEAPKAPPAERTPEDKRQPYDKRRRQLVIDGVRAKLEALAAEPKLATAGSLEGGPALVAKGLLLKTLFLLEAMLAERGWRNNVRDGGLVCPEGLNWEELSGFKNHELGGATREAALVICWGLQRRVMANLASRLTVGPGEATNEPHYSETEALCKLLGLDLPGLRAEAARSIPYAKSWRAQVSDDWAWATAQTGTQAEMAAANGRGSDSQ